MAGVIYVFRNYHITILQTITVIVAILALSATQVPQSLGTRATRLWNGGLLTLTSLFVGIALALVVVISILTLESRTREEREQARELERTSAELKQRIAVRYRTARAREATPLVCTYELYLFGQRFC